MTRRAPEGPPGGPRHAVRPPSPRPPALPPSHSPDPHPRRYPPPPGPRQPPAARHAPTPPPYQPLPEPPHPDETGRYRVGRTLYESRDSAARAQRYYWVGNDPATWRDLLWTVTNAPVGLLGLIPAVLVAVGVFGLVWQPISWAPWAVPLGLIEVARTGIAAIRRGPGEG